MTPTDAADDVQALAVQLRFGVTRLARLMRQQSEAGLTPTQLAALATLARSGPMPIGALADEEQIGAPTATKIVDKLEAHGYVERSSDAQDRRVSRVGVTADGQAHLDEVRARKTAWLTTRLGQLSPTDRAALARAAEVIEHLTDPAEPESRP